MNAKDDEPVMPPLLETMRTITLNPPDPRDDAEMKHMRDLRKKNPMKWLQEMNSLEKEYQRQMTAWRKSKSLARRQESTTAHSNNKAEPVTDEGTARCLDMARKLIIEITKK